MNSLELFERRDELQHVISEMRLEHKAVGEQLPVNFLPKARHVLRAHGKDLGTIQTGDGHLRQK